MFHNRTLFIVGAGASYEVGLPIGLDLAKRIHPLLNLQTRFGVELISGDPEILETLHRHCRGQIVELNHYLKSAREVSAGMLVANSIDSFLDNHQHDERINLCGKLAIVKSIVEAEKHCALAGPRPPQHFFFREETTWFTKFFRILHEGVSKQGADTLFENISIICFNYDRCIEHFLVDAVRRAYALPENEAEALVRRLKIYHPYGTVGKLRWQGGGLPFGGDPQNGPHPDLLALASGISTYTEKINDAATLEEIRQEVARAETIVFLGFGFNSFNLQLMAPPPLSDAVRRARNVKVLGTALGISSTDIPLVAGQLTKILAPVADTRSISLENTIGCTGLFDAYWRGLSTH